MRGNNLLVVTKNKNKNIFSLIIIFFYYEILFYKLIC